MRFKKLVFSLALAMLLTTLSAQGEYKPIITGYDWGADINKVVLSMNKSIGDLNSGDFSVKVVPKSGGEEALEVLMVYLSDGHGNRTEEGSYLTLVLAVSPAGGVSAPLQFSMDDFRNHWVEVPLEITHDKSKQVWTKGSTPHYPQLEKFRLDQTFEHEGIELMYADYTPTGLQDKCPLIIWLHGGGEGGKDTTIPLMANLATNYASEEMQAIFGDAFVLVPQTPGAWMHNADGKSTWGEEDDIYNQALMALIRDYVENTPGIDPNRILLGGCSNGGYMTIKLMSMYPDYFAAGFPSALAYRSAFLTDEQIEVLKDQAIWFIHVADDPVTPAALTVIPVYERLKAAGGSNIHLSMFDHAVDVTGFYGGKDFWYNGHFSWIYSHKNLCRLGYDGEPVEVDGRSVSLFEWLAAQ